MASDGIGKLKSEVISSNHINQKLKMKPGIIPGFRVQL